ncbi:hypothetical protein [Flavobacterium sp.]|uniref:hypothetical protein n=1 Tax=Flavobacterium sp. TaxID=239 RepID=UPI0039E39EFD
MIALNKELLANTFLIENAKSLRDGKFISEEQYKAAKLQTFRLKTQSNMLIRIGFGLLGIFLYSSIVGVISLFGLSFMEQAYKAMIFVYAFVGLGGSELFSSRNYYGYGLDDVFILGFQLLFCTAIGVAMENVTLAFFAMILVGFFCCVRYVNTMAALVGLVGIVGFFCCLSFELKIIPELFMPFVGLLLAMAMYAAHHRLAKNPRLYFYKYALRMLRIFSLVLGYVSINYLVVRELSVDMLHLVVDAQHDIPFAFVFYFLTFAIPVLYIWYSLQSKSREMLIIGMLCLACSILTIRYYYSVIPAEVALILGGILLFAGTYFCIRKLKHRESGITFSPDRNSDKNTLLYAQAILVNSQIGVKAPPAADGGMTFGGGGFSGGGSSETF